MTKERDIRHSVVAEIGDYTIVRSEAKQYNAWNQEYRGQTKVYYDVCAGTDLLETFKTLREAKRFVKEEQA